MNRTTRALRIPALALAAGAMLAAAIVPYVQGFEVDEAGWFGDDELWYGDIVRTASGTGGLASSEGDFHAIATGSAESGPFSRFAAYATEFEDGYDASIDVYLDPAWANGEGFDVSVAANKTDNTHRRDFIFHVTKDTSTSTLRVAASNNTNFAPREDLDTLANNLTVTDAGWYQLRWTFRDVDGHLAVDMEVLDAAGMSLFLERRETLTDDITEVGGNRYMWFTAISAGLELPIDQQRIGLAGPTSKDDCKKGGFAQYGYKNQGACVSDLMSNRPEM